MKILVMSKEGDGTGMAWRLRQEGHDVDLFIQDSKYKMALLGLVNRVDSWRPVLHDADLVICDMVGFGYIEQTIRKAGRPYLCCNKVAELAELDRVRQLQLFERSNIDMPDSSHYANPVEALDHLDRWTPPGYYIKPNGNQDPELTLYCPSPEVFAWHLRRLDQSQGLVVQQFAEGIEVSCEGWWNGRNWVEPFNITFEEKSFLPKGAGSTTGCMGNVVVGISSSSKLAVETVQRLEPFLVACGYRGPVDINCIVDEQRAQALELSIRPGYDAIEALAEALKCDLSDVLYETALAVNKEMPLGDLSVAVRVSAPPWPMGEPGQFDLGMPISGLDERNLRHIYLSDVMLDETDTFRYSACDGVVLKAAAHGRDVREALWRVYRTIDNITFPGIQYRDDIGKRAQRDIEQLTKWSWINVNSGLYKGQAGRRELVAGADKSRGGVPEEVCSRKELGSVEGLLPGELGSEDSAD